MKYFETSATSQDGKLSTSAATQDSTEIVFEPSDPAGKPSTSTASHRPVSLQLQSDPEDDGPFASTASHQDSLGELNRLSLNLIKTNVMVWQKCHFILG